MINPLSCNSECQKCKQNQIQPQAKGQTNQTNQQKNNFILLFFMILFCLIAVDFWSNAAKLFFFQKVGLEQNFQNYFVTAVFLTIIFVFALKFLQQNGNTSIEQTILAAEAF